LGSAELSELMELEVLELGMEELELELEELMLTQTALVLTTISISQDLSSPTVETTWFFFTLAQTRRTLVV